jgi:hypothetical protein
MTQLVASLLLLAASPAATHSPASLLVPEGTTRMRASDYSAVQVACRLFTSDSGLSCGSSRMSNILIEVFQDKYQLFVMFQSLNQENHLGNLNRSSIIYVLNKSSLKLVRKGYPE